MPPKAAPDKKQVHLEMPESGFERVLYVNRASVEQLDAVFRLCFWLDGEVEPAAECFLDARHVMENQQDWSNYMVRMRRLTGQMFDDLPDWDRQPSRWQRTVGTPFANVCRFGFQADIAELRFYAYSLGAALDASRQNRDSILAQPLLMIFSPLKLHVYLLSSFYAASEK